MYLWKYVAGRSKKTKETSDRNSAKSTAVTWILRAWPQRVAPDFL